MSVRLEALLDGVRELFGPRLSFGEVEGEWLPVRWDGVEEARAWVGVGAPDLPRSLLKTAHDAVLEGRGRRGEHPGPWVDASPEVIADVGLLCLVLRREGREIAAVALFQDAHERGGSP